MSVLIEFNFEEEIASKFKEFYRNNGESYSCTMELMLDFFRKNNLSPKDSLDSLHVRDQKIHNRINNVIAIIRDIERTQPHPTLAILELVMHYQSSNSQKKSSLRIKQSPSSLSEIANSPAPIQKTIPEAPKPGNQYYLDLRKDMQYLLDKTSIYRNPLGNPRLHLNISMEELESFKLKLKSY